MPAYTPDAWDSFFVANAGASAALAGLLFVGVSINLSTIAASGPLTRRALEAFSLLAGLLIVSVLVLVPGLSSTALAIELAGVGVVVWVLVSALHLHALAERSDNASRKAPPVSLPARIAFGQAATLPLLVGAATVLAESGGGLYWTVPAVVFSYVAALANAWVLLIEILR